MVHCKKGNFTVLKHLCSVYFNTIEEVVLIILYSIALVSNLPNALALQFLRRMAQPYDKAGKGTNATLLSQADLEEREKK